MTPKLFYQSKFDNIIVRKLMIRIQESFLKSMHFRHDFRTSLQFVKLFLSRFSKICSAMRGTLVIRNSIFPRMKTKKNLAIIKFFGEFYLFSNKLNHENIQIRVLPPTLSFCINPFFEKTCKGPKRYLPNLKMIFFVF